MVTAGADPDNRGLPEPACIIGYMVNGITPVNSRRDLRFEVTIEVPRWGFVKRGSSDRVDFVSPIPCPFNYGAIPDYLGGEGDLLDAVVLGPRLPRGTRITVRAHGAVGLSDRGLYDDKLICSTTPLSNRQRHAVVSPEHGRVAVAVHKGLNGRRLENCLPQ